MYSKEEAKKLREDFWDQYKNWSGRKRNRKGKKGRWLMNDTGIKQLKLKFHFDEKQALVGIEIDTKNMAKRLELWEKLESLKIRLEEAADFDLSWDIEYPLSDHKTVSRIFAKMDNISIYNREDWKRANDFFYKKMTVFEKEFFEYRDYIKY